MRQPYLVANLQDHPSLQEKVYDHLKQAILAGEIQPGERLLETRLAKSLRVSRIPVRESIRDAIRRGDGATAEAEMRAHVERPRVDLLQMMRAAEDAASD